MKRSLCLARRLPSCVCWNSRDVIPSSSAICSVSATGNLPIPNFKRRLSGERLRVQHENSEKRCLPLGTRVTAEENRNALLSNASSLAADERREQIFISDTEHHRIIVVNQAGNILDCIGSSPGFEDGTFENAMLCCPSSTVYDELNDCLYIADSKNNVIRRADLSKRTVDTVGRNMDDSESPLWSRILKWMRGFGFVSNKKPQQQTEEITDGARNKTTLSNPWHLNLAVNGSLIVASRGFESSWVLDPITGESSKISCEGSEAVHEDYEKKLFASKEKADTFNFIRKSSLTESTLRPYSSTDMVSLVAKIHQNLFFLETEGHVVRKMDLQTGSTTTLKLSNFGCLGFPSWWFIQPLSLLTADRDNVSTAPSTSQEDNILCHEIQLQPGRCLVCIDPVLPEGMALAAPVDDKAVLRQARGSVVDLSMFGGRLVSHKVHRGSCLEYTQNIL
ncbi:hypothetical protein MPTK1_7g06560 [Marchantia polymorpha subsp. ruderalis]|uniref:Uncharacterized protein n=2 Tax=Marchantia polymorpha TaxID=3197 RepID=A0AAF6BWT3_MARPO|nr:hypothetical protein MARPO_0057s0011 [Marchantia polymorpha]PTQ37371.1 hypothetical protein MARPO_0057s0011 [Marchantia polymorpha]BBN16467.1 hypothetical protein Mp_7g06560 [Marchantia polymorpha subsp. ruderalis]BBN16468.1 hypothetical protein Mp_7g06560 [Marchantia polymorpha subsp. ruderalis]|eukprot:PTQ37369.1 hypothetical protein MARPO_0057s0011 [Marchantia polymorpha]